MRILGIVILYYPDNKIKDNIKSYIDVVDELILWENSPKGRGPILNVDNSKIKHMGTGRNVGIGFALNEAVKYAKTNDYSYVLTMDQDSCFDVGNCEKYANIVKNANADIIFSPNYVIHGDKSYDGNEDLVEIEGTMTSGTLYPVSVFDKIGLFREDFFIDVIDTEFSLRAKQHGISIKLIPSVCLVHGLGYQKKKHKFLWKTFFPNEYSPIRSYYIVRNGIITKSLYPLANWDGYLFYWFYKRLFFVVCYEDDKLAKIKAILYGYLHGVKNISGEQTIFNETRRV